MHPLQAKLIDRVASVIEKVAAPEAPPAGGSPRLWLYKDDEGREFYLPTRKTTLRSPYDGKMFTTKPEKSSLSDVGKQLREKAKSAQVKSAGEFHPEQGNLALKVLATADKLAVAGPPVLFRYTDPETSEDFYLTKRLVTVRSPYTGKTFTAKPDKDTISDVGKDLRKRADEAPETDMEAAKPKSWKNEDGE